VTEIRIRLVVLAGLLASAAALFLLVRTIDVAEALDVLARAHPLPLAGILGVVALQTGLRAFRWSVLLPRLEDGRRIPFVRLVPALLVGYLGNAVLPARLGEPMRAVMASRRERVGMPEALGSVLVERAIDVVTLAPLAFVAALLVGAPGWVVQLLGVAAAVGAVILAILLTVGAMPLVRLANRLIPTARTGFRDVVGRFGATIGGPSRRPQLLAAAAISTAAWFLDATSVWLVAISIGVEVEYAAAVLIASVGILGTAIPSAPGYVGTFELAVAGTAGIVGVPPASALALAVLTHAMTLLPLALGGVMSVVAMGVDMGAVGRAARAPGHE